MIMGLATATVFAFSGSSLDAQNQIEYGNCGLISVDSSGEIAFPLMVVPGEARLSSNPGGKTRVECSGRMPQSLYERITLDYAVTEEMIGTGIPCFTPWGEATRDWKQIVLPSGDAKLICYLDGHSKR